MNKKIPKILKNSSDVINITNLFREFFSTNFSKFEQLKKKNFLLVEIVFFSLQMKQKSLKKIFNYICSNFMLSTFIKQ